MVTPQPKVENSKIKVEDLVRNHYLNELIKGALPITDSQCGVDQNTRNAGHKQHVVRVIAEGLTMAEDSNRSRKNYARYVITSKVIFFNTPATKRARTRQVPIIWTDEDEDEDEEGVLYPHEDALVIKATVASKNFD